MTGTRQQEPIPRQRPFVALLGRVWGRIARPHPSVTDVGARQQVQLMMGLALAISVTNILGIVASMGVPATGISTPILGGLTVICLIAFGLGRTRYYRVGSVLLPVGLSVFAYALILAGSDDPSISLYSSVPAALVMGSALLPLGGLVALVLGNTVAAAMLPFLLANTSMSMGTSGRDAGVLFSIGALLVVITAFRNALERTRLEALRVANRELSDIRITLEERVAERTRVLARRASYLEATAAVARNAALELDIRELLSRSVVSISQQFGFYHTGIFFLEPAGDWLVLQAASSEGGQRMLARGHRLRMGEGIVGYAAQYRQCRQAADVGEDAGFFDNPDLPKTRSEVALPLQARGELIGVLDVQSTEPQAFSAEDVTALEALADQVAVALSNARLFWEAEQALEAERAAYGQVGREEWQRLLRARRDLGYRYTGRVVLPVERGGDGLAAPAAAQATGAQDTGPADTGLVPSPSGDGEELPSLSLPIRYRGRRLGSIVAHKPADGGTWTPQETALMETLAEQLSLALDSARLYEETQRRATQERLMGEVTARMRETLDADRVLRTAVQEIRDALGLHDVAIRFHSPEGPSAESADMPSSSSHLKKGKD